MKHYNGVLDSPLPFSQASRIEFAKHRCRRFKTFHAPREDGPWSYSSSPNCINFTVNKPIKLYGVQHFGSKGGEYTVSMEVKGTTVKQSGVYTSVIVIDESSWYYSFDVQFDRPVCLVENKEYQLVSFIKGPRSWYGEGGQQTVESQGVQFTFRNLDGIYGTCVERGQFPTLFVG